MQSSRVLRSSSLWEALFAHLPSGVVVLLPVREDDGRIRDFEVLAANTPALEISGLEEHELLGRRMGDVHPMFRQRSIFGRYERVLEQDRADEFEQMLPVRKGDRTEPSWYGITAIPADGRLIVVFTSITRRKAVLIEAVRMMSVDDLTGIGNRRLLKSHFWHRRQLNGGMALLYFDLNGFKAVNDTHGHETGDEVLKIVAQRLKNSIRPTEAVARLGGDEFAVLLETSDPEAVQAIAERLRATVDRPQRLDDLNIEISTSVGIAIHPRDGDSFEALLASADESMYSDKHPGLR